MSAPSPPPAPDPVATARAQTEQNVKTATTQYQLNATNQSTPYGSLKYNQIGSWADGTPRFEATQSFSPEQQALYDQYVGNQQKLGTIGGQQIDRIGNLLSQPVDLSNEATEARITDLARRRLDPLLAQQRAALDTRLANQGITMGSEAWRNAQTQFDQSQNDAYTQLLLSGRSQAMQEALTARNQPINEINALMSGSQVGQPNYVSTPQTSVAPVDYAGMVRDNYAGALKAYEGKVATNNAMLGGIFGLAAAPLGGWARSERALKTDIRRIGNDPRGWGVYSFRYRGEATTHIGFMADEVEPISPEAVTRHPAGYRMINYGMLATKGPRHA